MALLDKILGRNRSLSDLSKQELRKEEIMLTKQRDKLFARMEQIGTDKQKLFLRGAKEKSPELRKALAMDFEIKTQEQLMVARELNLRAKEMLTVARLRMVKENQERGKALGRLNITDKDVAKITNWIEDDAVTQDMYTDRLNAVLEVGQQADQDALAGAGLSSAGQELMHLWDQLDAGAIKQDQAFEQADAAVKRRQSIKEE
jgi:hypothetical protein